MGEEVVRVYRSTTRSSTRLRGNVQVYVGYRDTGVQENRNSSVLHGNKCNTGVWWYRKRIGVQE